MGAADRLDAFETAGSSPPQWMTAEDVAAMLQVSTKTISRWTLREGLPALRIGKVTRYDRVALDRWLARQQQARSKRAPTTAAFA